MKITNIIQLADFLKTRDELNNKVHDIARKHGYCDVDSWNVEGDKLVVHFSEGGQYHPMVCFTRKFPLTELFN